MQFYNKYDGKVDLSNVVNKKGLNRLIFERIEQ